MKMLIQTISVIQTQQVSYTSRKSTNVVLQISVVTVSETDAET